MRYAIIGAGLAGLTCAYEITRQDPQAAVEVYEAADRIGGKLLTVPFETGPVDMGAEAFVARDAAAVEFFQELGLGEHLVYPSALRSLLYTGGASVELPRDTLMGIPATSAAVAHLVGEETARRIDAEATAPAIAWEPGAEVSVGALVRERYGDEVADRCVSALLGGVYSCAADDLGLRATIPALAEAMDDLACAGTPVTLSGAVAAVLERRPGGTLDKPVFATFAGGYAELYEALAQRCAERGAQIYVDAFVAGLGRSGPGFNLKGAGEGTYDRVVLATPAPTTALLLNGVAPQASAALRGVRLASSAVVGMRFDSAEGLPENSGVLVAADEPGIRVKAFTLSSKKWPHLDARGGAVVRASFGRLGQDDLVRAEEDDLVDYALDDLQKITGFDGRAAGLSEIFVQRWFGGLPCYGPEHLDTVARVRAALAEVPGVDVTGAWVGGVGVPAVLRDARAAGERVSE
ncbi:MULTISPECIES: protoporphyrinogen oxidase [unclassified Corynebacterium]|uniref:protoporphyrinogen oxidase n=1 Tax=unclassified Corynebacterium TaxID=2624378 RepID=UPI0029C9EFEF|nr:MULTISPECIES: protoporphyrinogen oxidase [unclassified Corynebacterium]WPF66401.1 protoporphyrinogen oxidase [Corynebacterium sp. 22KM0430]WPF68891.1 protoporphyrinogen oxidase [Corynebacterium sp. 21KM1197]